MFIFKLALVFFKVGFFAFGGGWATVRLLQEELVIRGGFLSQEEFADLISVSQITPGPVAVNMATYLGNKLGGFTGAILCTLALVAPPLIIFCLIKKFSGWFSKFISPGRLDRALNLGAVVLIAGAALSVMESIRPNLSAFLVGLSAFIVIRTTRLSPIFVLLGGGIIGILLFST